MKVLVNIGWNVFLADLNAAEIDVLNRIEGKLVGCKDYYASASNPIVLRKYDEAYRQTSSYFVC